MNIGNLLLFTLVMNNLFANTTNQSVTWCNSSENTIIVILYNQKGSPVRASRLLPNQSLPVPAGCSLELLS